MHEREEMKYNGDKEYVNAKEGREGMRRHQVAEERKEQVNQLSPSPNPLCRKACKTSARSQITYYSLLIVFVPRLRPSSS